MGMRDHRRTRARAKALRWPMTQAEVIVWTRLQGGRLSGFHFRKQHPLGPFIADFACVKSRVLIEIDGETHWRDFERRRDAVRTPPPTTGFSIPCCRVNASTRNAPT